MANPNGIEVLCKSLGCTNPVAKKGRICDECYLKVPGGRKICPKCNSIIHSRQIECAKHMLDAKGGVTRRPRGTISKSLRFLVYQRDSYTCIKCGLVGQGKNHEEKIKGLEIDHILPNAAGGDSGVENLQVLCRACNNSKRHYRL